MRDSIPYHLIVAYLEGISNAEEEQALDTWLKEKKENGKVYNDLRKMWGTHTHKTYLEKVSFWDKIKSVFQ